MIFNLDPDNSSIACTELVLISLLAGTIACQFRLNGGICRVHSLCHEQKRSFQSLFITPERPLQAHCASPGPPSLSIHFYYGHIMCSSQLQIIGLRFKASAELDLFSIGNFIHQKPSINVCASTKTYSRPPPQSSAAQ